MMCLNWNGLPEPSVIVASVEYNIIAYTTPLESYYGLGNPWAIIDKPGDGLCELQDGYGWSNSLQWPLVGTVNENRGFRQGHPAIDINTPSGTPVAAATPGIVVWAGWNVWGFGNLVVLAHGGGWQTFYAHLASVAVACGQGVAAGSIIGASGHTGAATWPHLHFEVRNGINSYDPMIWLEEQ